MSSAHLTQIVQNLMTEVDSLKRRLKAAEKQNETLRQRLQVSGTSPNEDVLSMTTVSSASSKVAPQTGSGGPPTPDGVRPSSSFQSDPVSLELASSGSMSRQPSVSMEQAAVVGYADPQPPGGASSDRGLVASLRRQIAQLERRDGGWREQTLSLERQLELLRIERDSERREHQMIVAGLNHTIEGMARLAGSPPHGGPSGDELLLSPNASFAVPSNETPSPTLAGPSSPGCGDKREPEGAKARFKRAASVVLKTRSGAAGKPSVLVAELSKEAVEQFGPVLSGPSSSCHGKTPSMGGAISGGSGPISNPNQLGETINTDCRDRQWYLATVIQRGLMRVIKDMGAAAESGSVSVVRGKPREQLQMLVKENLSLFVHLENNEPVLSERPPAAALPSLNKSNSDPVLCAAFSTELATTGASSTMLALSSYRSDQVELTFHCPVLFSYIRQCLLFDFDLFSRSVDQCSWRESSSPGKSDAVMYYFGHFVLKSVKETEYRFLKDRFLAEYARYTESNPYTLVSRFYCLFSLHWLKRGVKKRFVLMRNVFFTKQYINTIFDLKGSTIGRDGKTDDETSRKRTAFGALLLKDNDLPPQLVICGPMRRAILLAQIRADTSFLNSLAVVDYSCLIGMRSRIFTKDHPGVTYHGQIDAQLTGEAKDAECLFATDGGLLSLLIYAENDAHTVREDVYYIGIIDVLQTYTPGKRFENFAKGLLMDKHSISVVPPDEFAERLCKLLERISV
jgi:hypothetical protein